MTGDEPATYRTDRWNAAYGGWKHDDAEVSGRHLAAALDIARKSTNGSVRRRVVHEGTGKVVAVYIRGRRTTPPGGTS